MTATDELRRMLDERGITEGRLEYEVAGEMEVTAWDLDGGSPPFEREASFTDFADGATLVRIWNLTPAQAIAATLGDADATATRQGDAGTCHEVADNLRLWHPHETFDNDHMGEKHIRILYQLLGLGGALMMDGADAAEAVRDRLIQLLGGEDE